MQFLISLLPCYPAVVARGFIGLISELPGASAI